MKHKFKVTALYIFLILSVLVLNRCNNLISDWEYNDDCENFDLNSCEQNKPVFGKMEIELTFQATGVPITIYRGFVEDSSIVLVDTLWSTIGKYDLPVNYKYSVAAKYNRDGKTIIAIDATEIKRKSTNRCDYTCWQVTGGDINVKLR